MEEDQGTPYALRAERNRRKTKYEPHTLSRWRVTAYAPTVLAGKKALLQSCIFRGLPGEKITSSRTDSTSVHRLAWWKEL